MSYDSVRFSISPEVSALGVSGICFAATNLSNKRRSGEFDAVVEQSLRTVLSMPEESDADDPILADFQRLHAAVGVDGSVVASPQALLATVRRIRRLPRISLLVDIYNLVSIETRLSLGAHDLARVHGDISLRLADGSERFVPLGTSEPQPVKKGEYCYIDGASDVLCWLEVRQGDKTKLSLETREAMFMIQGNRAASVPYLRAAHDRLVELIQRFCCGVVRPLWASD